LKWKAQLDILLGSQGRTYRYYQGKPLFKFGSGLSLTTFSLDCNATATAETGQQQQQQQQQQLGSESGFPLLLTAPGAASATANVSVECSVKNTGALLGDEVVQVYHQVSETLRSAITKQHPGAENTFLDPLFSILEMIVYQDRLGTNT